MILVGFILGVTLLLALRGAEQSGRSMTFPVRCRRLIALPPWTNEVL